LNLHLLRCYARLLRHFANGGQLIRTMRGGPTSERAILRGGVPIEGPPGRSGLVEAIVEIWGEETYDPDRVGGPPFRPEPSDVILDAGANVGVFSLWAARRYPACRVVALEPFEENYRALEKNLRRFDPTGGRCEGHRVALGREVGSGHMMAKGSRTLDHVLAATTDGSPGADSVPIVPLSGLFELARTQRIAFLKVDIEGSERDAFEGAPAEVFGRIDRMAVEYHDHLRPGALDVIRDRLAATHEAVVTPSAVAGCGILLARNRCLSPA
jgi:FkbM family methyltransferase